MCFLAKGKCFTIVKIEERRDIRSSEHRISLCILILTFKSMNEQDIEYILQQYYYSRGKITAFFINRLVYVEVFFQMKMFCCASHRKLAMISEYLMLVKVMLNNFKLIGF